MPRSKNIRPKSPRLLDREIAQALAKPRSSHATRVTSGAHLSWGGERVPIDPSPRTIKSFELSRPYVVRHGGRLYTVVLDVQRGHVAHPAEVEGRTSRGKTKRVSHATKAKAPKGRDKTSDRINIDRLAKMLGLPDWESVDEKNLDYYAEMSRGADDEESQAEAEREAQEETYGKWYDGVEGAASQLFEAHGLELEPTGKQGTKERRYDFKVVPTKSWNDAAGRIYQTIQGVAATYPDFREFLDDHRSARDAVLSNLGAISSYPEVYGATSARRLYEMAW